MSSRANADTHSSEMEALERFLAACPSDESAWNAYEILAKKIDGPVFSEAWLARQYIRCLRSESPDSTPFLELASFFSRKQLKFNSMLCLLSALAADITNVEAFYAALENYDAGVMRPAPFRPSEPEQCLVSVVLATQNRPETLAHSIESVLSQTLRDFELLVINDGGVEESERVVKRFESPRIRYQWKPQGGHRSAMNAGLKMARGRYIAYLDDDDIYFPQHLEKLVGAAESTAREFVCSRNRWVVGACDGGQWREEQDLTRCEPFDLRRLHVSSVIADLNVVHRRSLAERVGLFREEPPRGGEWEYWVRCSHTTPICHVDSITGEVRVKGILPRVQPARAVLFTHLWRTYFGSAFGYALLTAAALFHKDEGALARVSIGAGRWRFLSEATLKALWVVCEGRRDSDAAQVETQIAIDNPGWLILKLQQSKLGWPVIASLPAAALMRLAGHVVRHPARALRRFLGGVPTRAFSGPKSIRLVAGKSLNAACRRQRL